MSLLRSVIYCSCCDTCNKAKMSNSKDDEKKVSKKLEIFLLPLLIAHLSILEMFVYILHPTISCILLVKKLKNNH